MSVATTDWITVPALARELRRPDWLVRMAVDAVGGGVRLGQYRGVPRAMIPAVRKELERRDQLMKLQGRRRKEAAGRA
jgi:hypothetical protein